MKLAFLLAGSLAAVTLVMGGSAFPQVRSIDLPPDNPVSTLKEGPGVELVRRNCVMCHSTDYIVRQPHSEAKRWAGEVKKMIGTYGAPVSDADAKVIVDYLGSVYGPPKVDAPAPKKSDTPAAKSH